MGPSMESDRQVYSRKSTDFPTPYEEGDEGGGSFPRELANDKVLN